MESDEESAEDDLDFNERVEKEAKEVYDSIRALQPNATVNLAKAIKGGIIDKNIAVVREIEKIKRVISFLGNSNPNNRSPQQVDEVIDDYKDKGFFAKVYKKKLDHEDMRKVLRCLKYRYLKKNEVLFKYNDIPDKAYIVFQGQIAVAIPKSKEQMAAEVANPDYEKYKFINGGCDFKNYKKDEFFYDKRNGCFKHNVVCALGNCCLFAEIGILNARPRTATI